MAQRGRPRERKDKRSRSATPTVTASARKNVPVTPVMLTRGRNTTIGVTVDPSSGVLEFRGWRCGWLRNGFARRRDAARYSRRRRLRHQSPARRPRPDRRASSGRNSAPTLRSTINVIATVTGITRPATSEVPQSRRKKTRMMAARHESDENSVANALDGIADERDWS